LDLCGWSTQGSAANAQKSVKTRTYSRLIVFL
jgi:hypothetical protein